jgi:hypothetical protein
MITPIGIVTINNSKGTNMYMKGNNRNLIQQDRDLMHPIFSIIVNIIIGVNRM